MPGTQEPELARDLHEETPTDEEPESSRAALLEENRAGFMLLDYR
jgi:hypothetical protein